mgnify:CR=1 FL=1
MKVKNIIIAMSMVFSLLAISCSENAKSENSVADRLKILEKQRADLDDKIAALKEKLGTTEKATPVELMPLTSSSFSHFTKVFGVVESDQDINMNPKSMGLIKKIFVQEGQRVKQGQVLAQIDNDLLQKNLKAAKDSYEFIKVVYEKQKGVWDKKVGSELAFLKAKNDKETMENNIAILEEQIANTKIVAPFSGVIDRIFVKEGETASPSMPAFHLVSENNLKIKADIAESVAGKLKVGDKAKVVFPDLDIDTLNLVVSALSQAINLQNRTVSVYVDLPRSVYGKVKPSMLGVTEFKTAQVNDAFTLPANIIQQEGTVDYVMIAINNDKNQLVAKKKIIVKGSTFNGQTEIIGGIKNGDKIITVGFDNLQDGDLIKTIEKK